MVESQRRLDTLMLTQADGKEIFFNQLGKGNFLSPFIKLSVPGAGSSALGSVNLLGSFESDVQTKDFGGSLGAMYIGRKKKRQFQPATQVTASFSSQTVLDRTPTNRGFMVQNTGSNDFFVGGSSVSSSNGYKLSPGEKTPFINCQLSGINVVQSTGSCTASTIST